MAEDIVIQSFIIKVIGSIATFETVDLEGCDSIPDGLYPSGIQGVGDLENSCIIVKIINLLDLREYNYFYSKNHFPLYNISMQ